MPIFQEIVEMSKTVAGFMVTLGPLLAWFGGEFSAKANNAASTPDTDWYYSVKNGIGVILILIGLGMFFFGAKRFATKDA
jgi:hypothetical protein